MLKAINKILGLLLFIVLVATCFYIFMPYEINDPELLRLTSKLQSLWPSVVLSLGALTAWVALQINRRHQEEELIRKESSFFFDECKERFIRILDVIEGKSNSNDQISYLLPAALKTQLESISHYVSDIDVLNKSIISLPFRNAYERDFNDVKRKVNSLLENSDFRSLSGFDYGEINKDTHTRIEEFNDWFTEYFNEDSDSQGKESHRRSYMTKHLEIPFPGGIAFETINVILQFFFDSDVTKFNSDAVQEYVELCNEYSNIDGILVRGK